MCGGAQHHPAHLAEAGRAAARRAAVGHGHPGAYIGLQAALHREGDRGRGLGRRCAGARALEVRCACLYLPCVFCVECAKLFLFLTRGR